MNEIEKINTEIEPLTPILRRNIKNAIAYHGIHKDKAAERIAQILKRPLDRNKIYDILIK